jgi:hypothetical protein
MTDTDSCTFTPASTEWIKSHLDRMDHDVPREDAPRESAATHRSSTPGIRTENAPPAPAQ